MDFFTLIQILDATVRLAIPLLLACLAGLFSERAGIFDIGLEGKMLAAAFFSAAIASMTGSVWIGLLAGIAASLFLSGVHGLASITFRGNQLISGVAINFLAAGMTVLIAQSWFSQGGRTPSLSGAERFNPINFPGALTTTNEVKAASPLMQVYSELLSGHSLLVYFALLTVPMTWWLLYRTRFCVALPERTYLQHFRQGSSKTCPQVVASSRLQPLFLRSGAHGTRCMPPSCLVYSKRLNYAQTLLKLS